MKNTKAILMSVLMIGIVATAVGGVTLADFLDTEFSANNKFSTGHMDLKISDWSGWEYDDPDVPALISASGAWPCCSKDAIFDLHNFGAGQPEGGYAYMHIKDVVCFPVEDKEGSLEKCEAERVAESGGWIDNVLVAGIGDNYGEDCHLADHVEVVIEFDTNGDGVMEVMIGNPIWGAPGTVYLSQLDCCWIDLGLIPNCNTHVGKISLHISDLQEEDFNMDYFDVTTPVGQALNDWPTAALMTDGVSFSIEFLLHQNPQPQLPDCPI
ncbi:hypothetical protein KAW18_10940 [candidate division WOR-3 bacterium]|nr:hypothetical protein [candidate division WOR-3 bacterium]